MLERVDAVEPAGRAPRRRGWLLTFALGGAVGGLAVASTASLRGGARTDGPPSLRHGTHLQAPVESLTIDASGDIAVQFGEGYAPEAGELARRTCEPSLEEALVLGLLACETTTPPRSWLGSPRCRSAR